MRKSKKHKLWLLKKEKPWLWRVCCALLFVAAAFFIYVAIWFIFTKTNLFSMEEELKKSDWLSFLGTYLSLVGTLAISSIAVGQTWYYSQKEKERRQDEYERKTMPKLSVSIIGMDSSIEGMDDYKVSDGKNIAREGHSNVTLEIRNVGGYSTTNIYIDATFIVSSLMPGERTTAYVAKPNSPDWEKYPQFFAELPYGAAYTEDGLPNGLFLQSNDVDGRLIGHEYQLISADGKPYYCYCEDSPSYS